MDGIDMNNLKVIELFATSVTR